MENIFKFLNYFQWNSRTILNHKKDASWVEIDKWVIFDLKIKKLDNLAKLGNEIMNELVMVSVSYTHLRAHET